MTAIPTVVGDMLCNAAARGNVTRLLSLMYAGADMNQRDISSRTALHLAVQHNHKSCVAFLLDQGVAVNLCDDLGLSALDVCRMMKRSELLVLLEQSSDDT